MYSVSDSAAGFLKGPRLFMIIIRRLPLASTQRVGYWRKYLSPLGTDALIALSACQYLCLILKRRLYGSSSPFLCVYARFINIGVRYFVPLHDGV